jgi:DNA topoisomerase-2
LSDITHHIFNEHDTPLLKQLDDDGMLIEPEHYVPILPMVLVNGTDGIGTGFRSKTPCYNPMDIVNQFIVRLKSGDAGEGMREFSAIHPWYRGFNGTIEAVDATVVDDESDDEVSISTTTSAKAASRKYISRGVYKIKGDTIEITELPVGVWSQNYKEFIEEAMEEANGSASSASGDKEKKRKKYGLPIVNYDNHSTDYSVRFVIKMEKGWLEANTKDIEKKFKLCKSISTSSMYLYDEKGVIRHYTSPEEIMENFWNVRMNFYIKRKEYLLKKLMRECIILRNKVKFIEAALAEQVKWNRSQEETEKILTELGLWKLDVERFDLGIDFETGMDSGEGKPTFHYLLEMKIYSLTKEKVDKLKREYEEKRVQYDELMARRVQDIWYCLWSCMRFGSRI